MNNGRDILWKEYYAAVKAGNVDRATLILRKLHSGPSQAGGSAYTPNGAKAPGGCKRCRRTV